MAALALPDDRASWSYMDLLEWHLYTQGTRPDGQCGKPWTRAEFVTHLAGRPEYEESVGRTVRNWFARIYLPGNTDTILRIVFGIGTSHAEAREELRNLFFKEKRIARTTPRAYASRSPYKLLSKLEYVQDEARALSHQVTNISLNEAIELEAKCWATGEDIRYYASLYLAYELLRAGPDKCCQYHERLLHLHRFAFEKRPESMAARWLLARIKMSIASVESNARRRSHLIKSAYNLYAGIRRTKLKMPVLLPGLQQEYTERFLQNSEDDRYYPLVTEIFPPHRYIAGTAIALATTQGADARRMLWLAEQHLKKLGTSMHSSGGIGPSLSMACGSNVIQSLNIGVFGDKGASVTSLGSAIEKLIDRVESARRSEEIPDHKAKEWFALSSACLALATREGTESQNAIDTMKLNLGEIVRYYNAVPDLVDNDPSYRLAIEQGKPGEFSAFLGELNAYRKHEKPQMQSRAL
jgi:hypothetical protein